MNNLNTSNESEKPNQSGLCYIIVLMARIETIFVLTYILLNLSKIIKNAYCQDLLFLFLYTTLLLNILSWSKQTSAPMKVFLNLAYSLGIFFILSKIHAVL